MLFISRFGVLEQVNACDVLSEHILKVLLVLHSLVMEASY